MIVTIEMATNMTAVVDKREIVYEFKSDLTIYDRHTYWKSLHGIFFSPKTGTYCIKYALAEVYVALFLHHI